MDLFFFDKADLKMTTTSGIPRCNLLQIFAKMFRFVELCLAVILLSWSLSRLPFAVRISGEYFGKLFAFVASPLFGFILCNAIIVALVAKPSKFSGHSIAVADGGERETDQLYEEFLKSGTDRPDSLSADDSLTSEKVEIVFQDKEMITEVTNTIPRDAEVKSAMDSDSESGVDNPKVFIRALSEKLTREYSKLSSEKLRRSETEKCRNLERGGEKTHEILYYQDDLSSEEFQRKIEAFIAKEKKFRRQESSAIVLHSEG